MNAHIILVVDGVGGEWTRMDGRVSMLLLVSHHIRTLNAYIFPPP